MKRSKADLTNYTPLLPFQKQKNRWATEKHPQKMIKKKANIDFFLIVDEYNTWSLQNCH